MPLLTDSDTSLAEAIAALADANPFTFERITLEQRILGDAYQPFGPTWHADGDQDVANPNTPPLRERVEALAATLADRLRRGATPSDAELPLYYGVVFYALWLRFEDDWYYMMPRDGTGPTADPASSYARFKSDADTFFLPLGDARPDTAHLFALGFQFRRAFDHIFRRIYGGSASAARLRAKVWDAIFTIDRPLYRTQMYRRMRNTPVLIIGETGTGKDLVARAIGQSQYLPFDTQQKAFVEDPAATFVAVHLAERSLSLIESELFGHERGAFTGADQVHRGFFEQCGLHGAVFLDEIGELNKEIQVKLLRVLQNREIKPIGATSTRPFHGRVVAATNRDLPEDVQAGRFREDLYFRLCGYMIRTPTLRAQLAECPEDLHHLVMVVARRIVGESHAVPIAARVEAYIRQHLAGHAWSGNMRELELCVTRVLGEAEYRPELVSLDAADQLAHLIRRGEIPCDELERRYVELLAAKIDSERELARITGRNPRTISKMLRSMRR